MTIVKYYNCLFNCLGNKPFHELNNLYFNVSIRTSAYYSIIISPITQLKISKEEREKNNFRIFHHDGESVIHRLKLQALCVQVNINPTNNYYWSKRLFLSENSEPSRLILVCFEKPKLHFGTTGES